VSDAETAAGAPAVVVTTGNATPSEIAAITAVISGLLAEEGEARREEEPVGTSACGHSVTLCSPAPGAGSADSSPPPPPAQVHGEGHLRRFERVSPKVPTRQIRGLAALLQVLGVSHSSFTASARYLG
jgi:hypothetical protein